ncbi:MAG: transposase [Candidatus Thermoplasmatota archaeon]|nr:transposase [Candidatus Thermoplasmatota archaeon]
MILRKPDIVKNTTKFRANTFFVHSMNGRSTVDSHENSKKEDKMDFFSIIRKRNPDGEKCGNNGQFHTPPFHRNSDEGRGVGYIIYLPSYSPDLNPMGFIWKSLKRDIEYVHLLGNTSETGSSHTVLQIFIITFIRKMLD